MSEPLGHEPDETRDREFAPVLREDAESLSREQARAQGRKVTGTGVAASVPADDAEDSPGNGTETRSELEEPTEPGDEGRGCGDGSEPT